MKVSYLVFVFIFLLLCLSCNDEKTITEPTYQFQFPDISSINTNVYAEIKKTCNERWDLDQMNEDTFEIIKDNDEYVINCDGYIESALYKFTIRTDKNGKWINDGCSLKNP